MDAPLRVESSLLLRETTTRWAEAVAGGNAAKARFAATQMRAAAAVVLAHPRVAETFNARASAHAGALRSADAETIVAFYEAVTICTFGDEPRSIATAVVG